MKRQRAGVELTMDCADFWNNKGRFSKSGMLRALKESEENQAEGATEGVPPASVAPDAQGEEA